MTIALTFVAGVGATLMLAPGAVAASFDCTPYIRSNRCQELKICQSHSLSQRDDDLNRAYNRLQQSLSESAVG